MGGQKPSSEKLLWKKEKETVDLWSSSMADHGGTGKIHHFKKLRTELHDMKSPGDGTNVSCNSRSYSRDWDYLSMKRSACGCAYVEVSNSNQRKMLHLPHWFLPLHDIHLLPSKNVSGPSSDSQSPI